MTRSRILQLVLEWLVRHGVLVQSGPVSKTWCAEHGQFCPPVWYRPARGWRHKVGGR